MAVLTLLAIAAALAVGIAAGASLAQQQPAQSYFVGNRLGLPINPAADGTFEAISPNVKVYGASRSGVPEGSDRRHGCRMGVPQPAEAADEVPR